MEILSENILDLLGKYFSLYALSSVKFILGPTLGVVYNLSILETGILTTLGMMTSVYLFSFFNRQIQQVGSYFLNLRKRQRVFTKRNRRFVLIWRKYGLPGVAFLTPLIFTPIGGTILANLFSNKKGNIVASMWVSAIFWSFVLSSVVRYGSDFFLNL